MAQSEILAKVVGRASLVGFLDTLVLRYGGVFDYLTHASEEQRISGFLGFGALNLLTFFLGWDTSTPNRPTNTTSRRTANIR